MWTNDPVADYERYSNDMESALEQLPECTFCGNHILDDYLYEIDGDYYCEECMKELFRKSVDDIMGW